MTATSNLYVFWRAESKSPVRIDHHHTILF